MRRILGLAMGALAVTAAMIALIGVATPAPRRPPAPVVADARHR